jgi:hypothetical protein
LENKEKIRLIKVGRDGCLQDGTIDSSIYAQSKNERCLFFISAFLILSQ